MAEIPQHIFSAEEERLQRESRRKATQDANPILAATKAAQKARKDRFDNAFAADQAQRARDTAAKRVQNTRAMPSAFIVGGPGSEQRAPDDTVAKLPPSED